MNKKISSKEFAEFFGLETNFYAETVCGNRRSKKFTGKKSNNLFFSNILIMFRY